jgi:hypothetical protein
MPGYCAQDYIALGMAKPVIYLFEVIQIHDKDGDLMFRQDSWIMCVSITGSTQLAEHTLELRRAAALVVEAGQWIDRGQRFKLCNLVVFSDDFIGHHVELSMVLFDDISPLYESESKCSNFST